MAVNLSTIKQKTVVAMFKSILFSGMLLSSGVCHAFSRISLWTIAKGETRVVEFLSEDSRIYCSNLRCSFVVVGRPDEIFVSTLRADTLSRLRLGEIQMNPSPDIYVLNLKSKTIRIIASDRFVELDIVFEDLPVSGHEDHPEFNYGGNPAGHKYVAPIQRMGEAFYATLSSERKTSQKTTFGIPGIIPFFGREKWFQKETSHTGTFFLEIFHKEHPSDPIVQLRKEFKDLWLLPSICEMASWTQGAKEPLLVVVDNDYRTKKIKGRILLIRPQAVASEASPSANAKKSSP